MGFSSPWRLLTQLYIVIYIERGLSAQALNSMENSMWICGGGRTLNGSGSVLKQEVEGGASLGFITPGRFQQVMLICVAPVYNTGAFVSPHRTKDKTYLSKME